MKTFFALLTGTALVALTSSAEVKTTVDHNDNDQASAAFKFKNVPSPSKTDAGSKAKFSLADGESDDNGGGLSQLNDGKLPGEEDAPGDNFFFGQGQDGGRIVADLGSVIEVKQVNTYSWHPNTRGPQVYKLYASDGTASDFDAKPGSGKDPLKCGWKLIAKVDTRPDGKPVGGQYGVSISDSDGTLGKFRYLLFVVSQTESDDVFGNTFYSEIDIVGKDDAASSGTAAEEAPPAPPLVVHSADGKYEITINTAAAPDLRDWAEKKLGPTLAEWYPKIVDMLPSDGYTAPQKFSVTFKVGRGVADTAGTRVNAYVGWLRSQTNGQGVGSIVHEAVHVAQQYGRARRTNPNATRTPGWLQEGIPDYIRFYLFEPQTHGADISKRRVESAKYDGSYRVTANFLHFVTETYDKDLVRKLNATIREGKYTDEIWKTYTGKPLEDLNKEWKADLEKKLGVVTNSTSKPAGT